MENQNIKKEAGPGFVNNQPSNVPSPKIDKSTQTLNSLTDDLGNSLRTLRLLEERYTSIRSKIQVSDQNIIEDTNKIFLQLKLITKDITDLKIKIEDMRLKLITFSTEIKEMASKQDLKILQRYVEFWEPMQFLTEKQAISLIRNALKDIETKNNK